MDVAEISLLKNKMKLPNMEANNEIYLIMKLIMKTYMIFTLMCG